MHRAIHTECSVGITTLQWKAIRASASAVASSALASLFSHDPHAASWPRKKQYFKVFFPKEWVAALIQLETVALLLTLCAPWWKADMTLGLVLSSDIIPSHPPSPLLSSRPSSLPRSQQPQLTSEPAPLHGTSGTWTQGTSVGSKHKRGCESSPPQQHTKKPKNAEHSREDTQKGTPIAPFHLELC
jgi:hypothetical protein